MVAAVLSVVQKQEGLGGWDSILVVDLPGAPSTLWSNCCFHLGQQ